MLHNLLLYANFVCLSKQSQVLGLWRGCGWVSFKFYKTEGKFCFEVYELD